MKLGFFVTFVAMSVQGFETSGDGTAEPDTVTGIETSSDASVATVSSVCAGKCDLMPNTECVIVQSNSNGFACPCLAGFELDSTGQCTVIINDTTEESVSDNISTVSTATVDLSGSNDSSSGVNIGSSTQNTLETTNPKIVQPGVTFQSFENLEEKSTSGSVLASVAAILVGALFL